MKCKVALGVLLSAWSVGYAAVSAAAVEQTLASSKQVNGKMISATELGSGLSLVTMSIDERQVPFLATDDGKILFQPDSIFMQDKGAESRLNSFYKNLYEKEKLRVSSKLKEVFKKQSANAFHFKAKKPTNKTIYIVSDPNCPFCQKEFATLGKRLEDANVEMIVVGFLGEDSMLKAANALKAKSGNQAKDIALLEKLYTPHSKAQSMDTKAAMELTQAVAAVGVRSVPYVVEE